jgi:hypothetical protein
MRLVLAGAGVCLLLIVGCAAFRLWPMLESARATLRVMAGEPLISLRSIFRMLLVVAPKSDTDLGTYYVTPLVLLSLLALPLGRARLAWCSAAPPHAKSHRITIYLPSLNTILPTRMITGVVLS